VESQEEFVFAAVLAWVKEDEAARKAELDRLLPLVRFPLMKEPAAAMMAEPLVATHALGMQLVFETHPEFAKSPQAAGCPRLVPRKGTKPPLDLSWMCTTDGFQGFRKLTHFPTVALAVSQSNVLDEGKVYDAPAGWHWATRAEVEAVPGWARKPGTVNYCGLGGWNGYKWEGVYRVHFAFRLAQAPTADLARSVHAGFYEGVVSADGPRNSFAGIVCIKTN
jgi:hypothetical protein